MQEETESFNKFFTTIGQNSADKLVPEEINNTKSTNADSVFLRKNSEEELSLAIKNLKIKYSSDYYPLNNFYSRKYSLLLFLLLTIWSKIVLKMAFSPTA